MRRPERVRRVGRKDPVTGVRKPYDVWIVRGKLKKTFRTKQEASAYCATLETEKQGGVTIDRSRRYDEETLVEFVASQCKTLRLSAANDIEAGLRRALPYLGGVLLTAITPRKLEDYRDKEERAIRDRSLAINARAQRRAERRLKWPGQTPDAVACLTGELAELRTRAAKLQAAGGRRSVNKSLSYLGTFFKWAQARGYCVSNPASFVKKLKVRKLADRPMASQVYTPEELQRLLAAADTDFARCALSVLAYGGLRLGECLGLQWGDVEFDAGRALVRKQLCAIKRELREVKTAAGVRFVELPGFVMKALREWKLACPNGPLELVFPNRVGGPTDQCDFRNRVFLPAVRRAGLRRIKIHDLRHTAASMLLASGADLAAVARQLGHASPAVTLGVYSHFVQRRNESGLGARLEAFLKAEAEGASKVA